MKIQPGAPIPWLLFCRCCLTMDSTPIQFWIKPSLRTVESPYAAPHAAPHPVLAILHMIDGLWPAANPAIEFRFECI